MVLILFSTIIDYWAALRMEEQPDKKKRRKFLALSLIGNLGMLFAFKYFDFFMFNTEVMGSSTPDDLGREHDKFGCTLGWRHHYLHHRQT